MSALNGVATEFETPNLDALAANSVVMSNGYVAAPLCSPSRAGLLTGQYPSRFGYENNIGAGGGLEAGQVLLQHHLKGLGYTTGAIGKWHLGEINGVNRPLNMGFDEFYGFLRGQRDFWEKPADVVSQHIMRGNVDVETQWAHKGDTSRYDPAKGRYVTDAFGEEGTDFINRHAHDANPFFLYVALNAPHTPLQAKQADLDRFPGITDPNRKLLAAMTYSLDRAVGDVTSALAANGIDDETIVVFLNDNGGPNPNRGPYNNAPLSGYKGATWEGGIRVPFLLSAPGIAPGVYNQAVTSIDLLPTLVNAAGGNAAQIDTNGTDLTPFLTGEIAGDPHELLFWRATNGSFAVRKGEWKLVNPTGDTFVRLYHVADDVHEDSYVNSQHPELVQELLRELTYWEAAMHKPKWGDLGELRNRFDHFVFRNDVAAASNWSTASGWLKAGTSTVVTFRPDDAYANAILEFGVRNDADYAATNNMLRNTGQTFMLNQLRLTGSFTGAPSHSATINGNALLFARNLDGQLPQIRLDATSTSAVETFAFRISNELQLLDDLEIVGNGTQQFEINGNIRDYYEPRNVIKKGTSSVTLGGVNTFGGSFSIDAGQVKLRSSGAAISGASSVMINGTAKLTLEAGTINTSSLVTATADSFEFLGGRLTVTNVTGSLENNGGTFAPGASPALTRVSGDFTQHSGVLEIELGGTTAGSQFDRLVIDGSATLGGILDVKLVDGYMPSLGRTFQFLTAAGGVSGGFADMLLPILSEGMWNARVGATSVSLMVTVEGDYNGNGTVDAADYTVWRDLLGQSVARGGSADGDFDGQVTTADYNIWKAKFGARVGVRGDYNLNGLVDAADYTVWRDLLGQSVPRGSSADGDFDGRITAADYIIWKANFGARVNIPGDYNQNGVVDAADYTTWRDALGRIVEPGTMADGDQSGLIDMGDYDVWKSHFGEMMAGTGAVTGQHVPEPAAAVMVLGCGVCLAARRRRRWNAG